MSKKIRASNGESQIEVTRTKRVPGGAKETFLIKKEDTMMADATAEINPDGEDATEAQKDLPDNPAVVAVSKKMTMNLGNFESVSVSVHLSMPCKPDKDHVNEMYDKVNKWVDARIGAERESVRRAQNG